MPRLLAIFTLLLAGCAHVPPGNIVAMKATTFGLDISSDPATGAPHVRLGLVRFFYQTIPVSTNALHVPPYHSDVDATIGITTQTVHEKFDAGVLREDAP